MTWIIRRNSKIFANVQNVSILSLVSCRWTEEEKKENAFCKDGVTLTGRDGMTYCHSNAEDEEEEEEVQCGVCG